MIKIIFVINTLKIIRLILFADDINKAKEYAAKKRKGVSPAVYNDIRISEGPAPNTSSVNDSGNVSTMANTMVLLGAQSKGAAYIDVLAIADDLARHIAINVNAANIMS